MKHLFLIFANIFFVQTFFGQFTLPIKQDAVDASKRILVLERQEIPPEILKKFKKEDDESEFINSLYAYSEFIQKYLPKYWKLNDSIIFKKTSEIYDIMDRGDDRYLIFVAGPRYELRASAKFMYEFSAFTFLLYMPGISGGWNNNYVDVRGGNFVRKGSYLLKLSFPSSDFNENDIKLMCNIFKNNIERAKIEGKEDPKWRRRFYIPGPDDRVSKLKTDTLLIVKGSFGFDENEIGNFYKYPYKVVSLEEQEDIIAKDKKGYAFFYYLWDDRARAFMFMVLDTEKNEVLARAGSGQFIFTIGAKIYDEITPLATFRSKLEISEKALKALSNVITKYDIEKEREREKQIAKENRKKKKNKKKKK